MSSHIASTSTDVSPAAGPFTTSSAEGDWVEMFDGHTLNGWQVYEG
jgi:hypothetical protein